MRKATIVALIFFLGRISWAEECPPGKRFRCLFTFEGDKVRTGDQRLERIYSFPPLKAGFVFDFNHVSLTPYASLRLFGVEISKEEVALSLGVAYQRVIASLDWEYIPIIRAGPIIWGGFNIEEKSSAFGVGFSILRF